MLTGAATGRQQQVSVFTATTANALRHWNILTPSGEAIGRIPSTGLRQYYAKDHLGSTRAVVNESNAIVERHDFDAYGMELAGRGLVGTPVLNERYTGHQWDAETGLLYAGARFLDPAIGRFLSVDPLEDADEQVGLSPYQYGWNNPLTNTDPDGKCPNCVTAAIGAVTGGVVGGLIETGKQTYNQLRENGSVSLSGYDGSAIGGAAVRGAITGGVAGATGGLGLIGTSGSLAAAEVAGGAIDRASRGQNALDAAAVATDAFSGAIAGAAASGVKKVLDGPAGQALQQKAKEVAVSWPVRQLTLKLGEARYAVREQLFRSAQKINETAVSTTRSAAKAAAASGTAATINRTRDHRERE